MFRLVDNLPYKKNVSWHFLFVCLYQCNILTDQRNISQMLYSVIRNILELLVLCILPELI